MESKRNRDYIKEASEIIEKRKSDVLDAIKLLKNPKITTVEVAGQLNINRSTIHRNKELKEMIDNANQEIIGLKKQITESSDKIRLLEEENQKLKQRDIEYMILKEQYNQLLQRMN